jgi:hypothetical protein
LTGFNLPVAAHRFSDDIDTLNKAAASRGRNISQLFLLTVIFVLVASGHIDSRRFGAKSLFALA